MNPAPTRALVAFFASITALCGCGAEHLVGRAGPAPDFETPGFRRVDSPTGLYPDSAAAGDLDGDGRLDLVLANSYLDTVTVLLGRSGGAFAAIGSYAAGEGHGLFSVTLGDTNGDKQLDLIIANQGGLVLLGRGDGTFSAGPAFPGVPGTVAAADLDGDGDLDLVTLSPPAVLAILLGTGDGTFRLAAEYGTGDGPLAIVAADLDRDRVLDLAVANFAGRGLSVFLGLGGGAYGPRQDLALADRPRALGTGDLDGDGLPELAVLGWDESQLTVFANLGGRFVRGDATGTGTTPVSVALSDLDGDGKLDVAVANLNSDTVSLLTGRGDGTFAPPLALSAGRTPTSVLLFDTDGDGRKDVVVTSWNEHKVRTILRSP